MVDEVSSFLAIAAAGAADFNGVLLWHRSGVNLDPRKQGQELSGASRPPIRKRPVVVPRGRSKRTDVFMIPVAHWSDGTAAPQSMLGSRPSRYSRAALRIAGVANRGGLAVGTDGNHNNC